MFDKLKKHEGLMQEMFQRTGVDISNDGEAGAMSANEYRTSLIRCSQCDCTDECRKFLDATEGKRVAAPSYCRNR
ncbi:MAG: DUF6455 family protein [Neomegalonema sp.]|nr:DUF6455 family protein [Neomegalonema sp.]